jgi:hypothetical protein
VSVVAIVFGDADCTYRYNADLIASWDRTGWAKLPASGCWVHVHVEKGGDENWHCCMHGQKDGKCNDICLHCYMTRQEALSGTWKIQDREERMLFTFAAMASKGLHDHVDAPILKGFNVWNIHYCIMHATIPFGKDMLTFMYRHALTNNTCAAADAFLKKHKIKVQLSRGPNLKGSWHLKATETFTMFQHFDELCAAVGYQGCATQLVQQLLAHLKTLYKWEFTTDQDFRELIAYERNFPVFLDEWREEIVQDAAKYRNYWHTLMYKIPESIWRFGSAWKYSSDITETYVCLLKDQLLDFTTRGGFGANPCVQVMQRMAVRSAVYSKGLGNVEMMISPYEKKRLNDIFLN